MSQQQQDDVIFLKRMAPHLAKGLSFEDAGRAVLADDQRILATLRANPALFDEIAERMARKVWCDINGRAAWPTTVAA